LIFFYKGTDYHHLRSEDPVKLSIALTSLAYRLFIMTSASRFCRATLMLKAKAKTVTANMFQKHLLLTNLGISLSLTSAGDALQQYYVMLKSSDRSYNSRRTFNMGVAGSALGFIGHHYYNWIDKFLPGRTWLTVGKKVQPEEESYFLKAFNIHGSLFGLSLVISNIIYR